MSKDFRIAIIGGGIGGASLANALNAKGIHYDIYEQAPEFGEVGAGIGLRAPSVVATKKWGIFDKIEAVTHEGERMQIIAGDDHILIEETWPVLVDADQNSVNTRLIHRADLIDALTAGIPEESIHFNYRLVGIKEFDTHVEVMFDNGHVIEADIVIAADGIRSPIRQQLIGNHEPVYSGYLAHRALIDFEDALGMAMEDNTIRIYVDGDNSWYMLPLLKNRHQVSVDITIPGEFAWRPELTKEQLMEGVKGFGPTLQKVLEKIDMKDIVSRPLCDLEPFEKWSTNRVTLLGDAAHAMLHNQGQGANMAIQDADVLADYLEEVVNETLSIKEALYNYQEARKPITKLYQDLSRVFPTQQAETAFPEKAHL